MTDTPSGSQPQVQVIRPEQDVQERIDAAQRQEQEQAQAAAQPTRVVQNEAADAELARREAMASGDVSSVSESDQQRQQREQAQAQQTEPQVIAEKPRAK